MAHTATRLAHNVVGTRREELISVDLGTGSTSGAVPTHLSWIDSILGHQTSGTDMTFDTYPNSSTAATTQAVPGTFFFQGAADGAVYTFLAIGR